MQVGDAEHVQRAVDFRRWARRQGRRHFPHLTLLALRCHFRRLYVQGSAHRWSALWSDPIIRALCGNSRRGFGLHLKALEGAKEVRRSHAGRGAYFLMAYDGNGNQPFVGSPAYRRAGRLRRRKDYARAMGGAMAAPVVRPG